MIGMILVTHGKLAEEFVHAMEHVVGRQEAVATVCIGPNDDVEKRRREIAEAITQVDSGEGAIILTDLFGGTPSNLAISLMQAGRVEVIAGINLPMLIRLAGARRQCRDHRQGRGGQCGLVETGGAGQGWLWRGLTSTGRRKLAIGRGFSLP